MLLQVCITHNTIAKYYSICPICSQSIATPEQLADIYRFPAISPQTNYFLLTNLYF